MPKDFNVVEEAILGEEFYVLKYSYLDDKNQKQITIDNIRLRWKPWEYYYEYPEIMTDEELMKYKTEGTLNSRESDIALRLLYEQGQMNKNK